MCYFYLFIFIFYIGDCYFIFSHEYLISYFLIQFSGLFTIGRWKGIKDICDTRLKKLSTKLPATILNSNSDNTVEKYKYGFKTWYNWCNTFDSVKPISASDIHISLYIIFLMQTLCSVAKINEVVYSIGWAHEGSGFENPCDSFLVKNIVEGARRQLSRPCTKKEPITPDILRQFVDIGLEKRLIFMLNA